MRDDDDDYMATPFVSLGGEKRKSSKTIVKVMTEEQRRQTAIDITGEDLRERLTVQNVADLVLLSMVGVK